MLEKTTQKISKQDFLTNKTRGKEVVSRPSVFLLIHILFYIQAKFKLFVLRQIIIQITNSIRSWIICCCELLWDFLDHAMPCITSCACACIFAKDVEGLFVLISLMMLKVELKTTESHFWCHELENDIHRRHKLLFCSR